jgi:transposase-like protein
MARSRRTFTAEFKAEAARRITERGKGLSEVARELDLGEDLLRGWKQAWPPRAARPSPAAGTSRPPRRSCGASEPRTSGSGWGATS